ncbi:MAG: EAL domain-containing protein, partial [Sedimenticola sp.]|nr:EAL domain-containing protein [Sedimenticola sp.]
LSDLFTKKLTEATTSKAKVVFDYSLNMPDGEHHYDARLNTFGDKDELICVVRDITEPFQIQRSLEINEQRFRTIFEQAAVGVALIDSKSGEFIRINQCYCDMVGYTLEEMSSGKTFHDITHPDDLDRDLNNMSRLVAGKIREFSLEKRYLHKNGTIVWVNLNVSPTWPPGGEPTNHIAVAIDITEQKLVTTALHQSEKQLLEAERIARMGNWELDIATGRAHWSDEIHQIMGTHPTMEPGPDLLSTMVNPDDWPAVEESLTAAMQGKKKHEMEYRIRRPDGEERWLYCKAEQKLDVSGRPEKLTGIAQDITERKRAEALQLGQQQILELISQRSNTLKQICEAIILFAEKQNTGLRGSILLVEENRLYHCAAPNMPQKYNALFNGLPIGPRVGSCGTAAFRKERVIVSDVAHDPLWLDYRELGTAYGFSACWSEPIQDGSGNVTGTFALYREEPGQPDDNETHLIEVMARLAGIAIERNKYEKQLARADSEWTQAMDQFDEVIYLVDMQRRLLKANAPFYQMIGSTPEQSIGRPITELIHPEGEDVACPICRAQEEKTSTVVVMEPTDSFNPSKRPTEVSQKLVYDNNNTPSGMLVSLHDLTRTRQTEERLRLAASVFENTDEGVIITDNSGTILDVNRAFTEIMGYSRNEVIGRNPRLFKSGRHDETFYRDLWHSLITIGSWRGEMWNRRKSGELFPEWQTISSVKDNNGKLSHYVSVFSDITQIKNSQEQLEHLGHHDALTDLPNRLLLNERMEQAIKHAERHDTQLALIFLDLDNFKHINDSLGHPVGDQLLQNVAHKLQQTVRQDDTVARIGGDEFVLLLEDIGKAENAGVAAQKLMEAFDEPFQLQAQTIRITASMGICICPQDGTDPATLLRNADSAMYRAKEEGRNTYQFYTEQLTRNAFERVLLENNLRQAIEHNQLNLLYQPQKDLQTGAIIGVEALIRWNHPELGMISPSKFIPMAEESGLIHLIGRWVLETACRQGQVWLEQGIEFGRIAVNIAGPQIQRGGLITEVVNILESTQLPSNRLELEVTEGFIMQETASAINQLLQLRELGITLAIDDFGTGYSSLSYLKKLPIHKLKIDQSFIRDIPEDKNDMAIADAIIAMGKSLGLTVIAEGVETEEQAAFLKKAGCQEVQGYLYSRPITPEKVSEFFSEQDN